jgi:predicted methyltransferase
MTYRTWLGVLGALCLSLGAAAAAGPNIPGYIAAAVADPNRPEADTKRDTGRKPAEVVAFAGVKPGDKVIELDPGPLYFTRILSDAVGPRGRIYAYVPSDLDELYKKNNMVMPPPPEPHYPNVAFIYEPIAKVRAPEAADVVWTTDNLHDFHNKLFGPADMTAVNAAIYRALKPGGVYLVADHAAAAGSGLRDTETLHRIDPAVVKAEALAAGFVLEGESQALRNPADDHTKRVFDPSIRGVTDQFIFKFRKPGGRAAR